MVIEWKECEHEGIDSLTLEDPNCLHALRNCGVLKFFFTTGLRAQPKLLQYLISLCEVGREVFVIHDQELELETSDIYFITELSRIGEPVQLYGGKHIRVNVNTPLAKHCLEALKSKSCKVDIITIGDLVLKVLLLTINKVVGAQALNESNKSKFQYAIDCMAATVFN